MEKFSRLLTTLSQKVRDTLSMEDDTPANGDAPVMPEPPATVSPAPVTPAPPRRRLAIEPPTAAPVPETIILPTSRQRPAPAPVQAPEIIRTLADLPPSYPRQRSAPPAAADTLPVIGLDDVQRNLQRDLRRLAQRGEPQPPAPQPARDLPVIDPAEVRASLQQLHGKRREPVPSAPRHDIPEPVILPAAGPAIADERQQAAVALFGPRSRFAAPPVTEATTTPLAEESLLPAPAPVAEEDTPVPPVIAEPAPPAPQPDIPAEPQVAVSPAPAGWRYRAVPRPAEVVPVEAATDPITATLDTPPAISWPAANLAPAPAAASPLVWQLMDEVPPDISHPSPVAAKPDSHAATVPAAAQPPRHIPVVYGDVTLPALDLLRPPETHKVVHNEDALIERGILIEEKCAEFKVKVAVVDAYAGPVITRYEVEPAVGVRGSQVVNLSKDLSRALGLASIRVVETIPGKTCMGLELPNPQRQMIRLSEILGAEVFQQSASKLTLVLGQDITGAPVVTDLAKAPHLLVAGTTGSGKSVGVNAMILSMLFKATPDEVRFIMIDPKMLELSVYNDIPHLLAPVVTDMKLAANALNWCVGEMEKRYRLMSHLGVRNIAGYNDKVRAAEARGQRLGNPFSLTPETPEPLTTLPFIVVVVDEFADLMMVAGKKIEELIARLAQKARAAGIHLILATQRPSVDVITGLIKANIPTRVAFQVSSKIDSRTILDQMGAESLLGQGDMLFLPPGTGYPQRVHGAFVTDEEVHAVVEYLKAWGEPDYIDGILTGESVADDEQADAKGRAAAGTETDPLYDEAVEIVLRTRKASISSVQRQLRIGYNRAARLIEDMEAAGIVSAMESNGNRTVLVPQRDY